MSLEYTMFEGMNQVDVLMWRGDGNEEPDCTCDDDVVFRCPVESGDMGEDVWGE
jgi:hypothetical protein